MFLNILKKIFPVILGAVSLLFIFSFAVARAAEINVTVSGTGFVQGQAVQVNVSLDTQGASANAVQGEITFPADMFRLGRITDGASAVSLWLNSPQGSAPGTIGFAGIMPGGFSGSDGALFSFGLVPVASGTAVVQVASATVLANDGLGSPLPVTLASTSIAVAPASTTSTPPLPSAPAIDYTAPNPFTPQIVSDPNIFNGQYFLVFATTDNASGIDHYEVLEVPSGGSEQPLSSWQVATSPYLLKDQTLSSDIYVRAVDHDGNFVVVKLPAEHPYAGVVHWSIMAIILIGVLVLMLLLFLWIRRRRARI